MLLSPASSLYPIVIPKFEALISVSESDSLHKSVELPYVLTSKVSVQGVPTALFSDPSTPPIINLIPSSVCVPKLVLFFPSNLASIPLIVAPDGIENPKFVKYSFPVLPTSVLTIAPLA